MAAALAQAGFDAVHPLQIGRRGQRDDTIVRNSINEDRIVITRNAADFVALLSREEVHPGLFVLPELGAEQSIELVLAGIAFLGTRDGTARDIMVNHVLVLSLAANPQLKPL
jgi:hypothetical protein